MILHAQTALLIHCFTFILPDFMIFFCHGHNFFRIESIGKCLVQCTVYFKDLQKFSRCVIINKFF